MKSYVNNRNLIFKSSKTNDIKSKIINGIAIILIIILAFMNYIYINKIKEKESKKEKELTCLNQVTSNFSNYETLKYVLFVLKDNKINTIDIDENKICIEVSYSEYNGYLDIITLLENSNKFKLVSVTKYDSKINYISVGLEMK
ncbi:MAG: hypothetical protein ACERKV_05255 [Clostridiaceae bacterium]